MKKLLSLVLALCLVLGVVPASLSDEVLPEENVASEPAPVVEEAAEEPAPAPAPAPAEEKPAEKKEEKKEEKQEEPKQVAEEPAEEVKEDNPPASDGEEQKTENPPASDEEEQKAEEPSEMPKDEETEEKVEKTAPKNQKSPDPEEIIDLPDVGSKGTPPNKPANLEFSYPKPKEVTLSWDAVMTPSPANGYEVRWGTTDDFNSAASTAVRTGGTSYIVKDLTCGVKYYYWVRAYYENTYGNPTDWSPAASANYTTSPAAPTGFSFNLSDNSAVRLDFTWTSEPESDGYIIYSVVGDTVTKVGTVGQSTATSWKLQSPFTPVDELVYRIRSYKVVNGSKVKSADYAEYKLTYKIPAPNDLKAESVGKDSIRLSWKAMEGATKYVVACYGKDGSEWITVAEQTGTTFTDTGLNPGRDYTYTVTAWVGEREGQSTDGVTAQATGVAPGNFKVVNSDTENKNTISWSKVDQVDGYWLSWANDYDSSNGSAHWNDIDVGNNLSYEHDSLTIGDKYSYKVCAYVIIGSAIAYYSPESVIVTVEAKPQKVTNLVLENLDYKTQELTWDAVTGATGYEVDYSTSKDFSKDKVTANVTVTSFTHDNCVNGTKYYYRVRAYKDTGSKIIPGAYSDRKSLRCAPAKPTVTAAYTPGNNRVTLSWALVDGATDFQVFYKQNDADWTLVATVKATSEATQSYKIKNLTVGSQYMFAVSAVRTYGGVTAVGEKGTDGPIMLEITDFDPTDLAYTVVTRKQVTLTWSAPKGITLFAVTGECAELPNFKDEFGEKEATTNSITIGGLKAGYNYTFYVQSKVVANNVASYGNPVALTDVIPTSLPPANVKVKADTVHYGAILTWEKSKGASGYMIYVHSSPDDPDITNWTLVMQITDPDTLTYTDNAGYDETNVGDPYYYRVYSYIDHGGEQISPTPGSVKYVVKAPKPTLKLTATGKTTIEIDVTNSADIAADKYYIYRSTNASSGFGLVATTATLPWTDSKITFGTTYYYYAKAVIDKSGTEVVGPAGATVSGQGRLQAVQNPTIKAINGGSIKVGWDALAGATGYEVYYRPVGGSWKLSGSTTKTKLTITGLNPKTEYQIRIAGTAKAGSNTVRGNYSVKISATTAIGGVMNLAFSPKNCTSVNLTWDKTTDATSYEVWVEDPVVNYGVWTKKATVTTNSATLTGLGKNKEYNFRVRAIISRNGIKDKSAYTLIGGYTAPAKVTGVTASRVKATKIILKWDAATGADGYRVQYCPEGGSWSETFVEGATTQTFTGLTSGTEYTFRVTAYWAEGGMKYFGKKSVKYKVKTK